MNETGLARRAVVAGAPALAALVAAASTAKAAANAGLTTHMLDTVQGKPAAGVRIDFMKLDGDAWSLVRTVATNADGRNDQPLLTAETMAVGRYKLVFHVAAYFAKAGVALADPPFLDTVELVFGIADASAHYHVPILASPWSYTTYRGS